ncbi:MAG: hypothetical protein A4E45_00138 [Methanosaeta sp. PtaB.Bin039]|nr:MAG: hypothetical protein A4E45_00138 [Methanosaeta sp. PtaB.Bin039]OPY47441.1 MAG: hypothetical protein A4E47_00279 [Methanosaeta sp. PtaU1.Bin028]
MRERILILGAAGRDFHNFNMAYRDRPGFEVVGFTAAQIPGIAGRTYPPCLAGRLYPDGIPIYPESDLEDLIRGLDVDRCILAYSDLSASDVVALASRVVAAGADFGLLGGRSTMLKSRKRVIAVCAVRTGAGKSQVSRYVAEWARGAGLRPVVLRHPMPYGDLTSQAVQRFSDLRDLELAGVTMEEREEYEPHIHRCTPVYAGVDYEAILKMAEKEGDLLIWDGGNNDLPFLVPDLWITVADARRPDQITGYYPGEANLRAAQVILINKANTSPEGAKAIWEAASRINPQASLVCSASILSLDRPDMVSGKRVLVVEDGPSLTHGGMQDGAGAAVARQLGAAQLVDGRVSARGSIAQALLQYPHIGPVLPALGYYPDQLQELEDSINHAEFDTLIVATPVDLGRLIRIDRPTVRVRYELADLTQPALRSILHEMKRKWELEPQPFQPEVCKPSETGVGEGQ